MNKQIVSSMFKVIQWKDEFRCFIECPGKHFHKERNANRDCQIHLDGAPTIFCFHSSCSAIVEEANYKLRRALWDKKIQPARILTEAEKIQIRKNIAEKKEEEKLVKWSERNREKIFDKYSWPIADVFHESPFMTDSPEEDSKIMLSLYNFEDVLWIGEPTDSGYEEKKIHFRPVKEWLKAEIGYHFTCPSTFKPESFSRSNENVMARPYLVVESDTLTPDQTCSIFKWMTGFLKLKAVIFTGGKSMHGWFSFPSQELFKRLKVVLPALGCDEALFKASQPVRMPGIKRNDKWQSLYWFDGPSMSFLGKTTMKL